MKKFGKHIIMLFLLLVVAGCSFMESPEPDPVQEPPETMEVAVYYLKSANNEMYLVREVHEVEKSEAPARAALNELINGTPTTEGAIKVLPTDTKILGIKIDQGLATVDFSSEVLQANVGSSGEALGIASIVNTLTEFPSIQKVQLTVDGDPEKGMDWWGHVGLYEQPFAGYQHGLDRLSGLLNQLPSSK